MCEELAIHLYGRWSRLLVVLGADGRRQTLTFYFMASDGLLDFVFDCNDDLYVESDAGETELLEFGETTSTLFDMITGLGKLAIAADGYLVRVIPGPVSDASYEEWAL